MVVTEQIWTAAAKSLTNFIISTSWGAVHQISSSLQQQILKASKEYIQKYRIRYSEFKILGLSKPISLEAIYTSVQLVDAENIYAMDSAEASKKN